MSNRIGLRIETKDSWEKRVVLTPTAVQTLTEQGIEIQVEQTDQRAFDNSRYAASNAVLVDDVRPCDLVLGVKEIPADYFIKDGKYCFFSHTFKGQAYNMKMLRALVEQRCTLMDYELMVDGDGNRIIFFGRYAGIAGLIDTLWTLGQRLNVLGHKTPFLDIQPTHTYGELSAVKAAIEKLGARIASEGLPEALSPMSFAFLGYGHVAQGAFEVFDLLPHVEVAADDLASFSKANTGLTNKLIKVVYREQNLVAPKDPAGRFELTEYYEHPERYQPIFAPHLEHLSAIVNAIYWEDKYPRFADADQLKALFASSEPPKLTVVGDITCDPDGSLACTMRDTELGDPVYVYNPETRETPSGVEGPGLSVMAIGNLPTSLPREASETFSEALLPYIPGLAAVDLDAPFEEAALPGPIRTGTILWNGEFTPKFKYMEAFLEVPNAKP
jgi:alanine dehydrogenase